MTPGENRTAANAELHLAFDFFPVLHHFFPIDLGLSPEHDCSDERIGAVRRLNAAGSQVRFALKVLAAFTVVELSARSQLRGRIVILLRLTLIMLTISPSE